MSTWVVVTAASVALVGAVSVKFWSAMRLMSRYRVEDYLAIPEARRLYWAGKLTPVVACAAIVVLSYCTHLWWLELPAWLFLAIIVGGVTWRVSSHSRRIGAPNQLSNRRRNKPLGRSSFL